jgi:hypothetical protein
MRGHPERSEGSAFLCALNNIDRQLRTAGGYERKTLCGELRDPGHAERSEASAVYFVWLAPAHCGTSFPLLWTRARRLAILSGLPFGRNFPGVP